MIVGIDGSIQVGRGYGALFLQFCLKMLHGVGIGQSQALFTPQVQPEVCVGVRTPGVRASPRTYRPHPDKKKKTLTHVVTVATGVRSVLQNLDIW